MTSAPHEDLTAIAAMMGQAAAIVTDSTPTPVDFGNDFDAWLGGATIAKRSVQMYANAGLYAEYQQLERDLQVAQASAADGEMAGSGVARIEARMAEVYDEWQASKAVWTVHAIDRARVDELAAREPVLVAPVEPEKDENGGWVDATAGAVHEKATEVYAREVAIRVIADATVSVVFGNGASVHSVTVDQVRRLHKTFGDAQLVRLRNAAQLAAMQEAVIPAPFSRENSSTDQTS